MSETNKVIIDTTEILEGEKTTEILGAQQAVNYFQNMLKYNASITLMLEANLKSAQDTLAELTKNQD